MTSEATVQASAASRRDWRIWFGVSSSLFWLWLGYLYVDASVGWSEFASQPADTLGSFLEGAFAPLAFLWLVLGFFLQQGELRHNNRAISLQYEEMRRANVNAEIQAKALQANELHQRQETFLLVADRVHKQLGSVVGLLWMSSQVASSEDTDTNQNLIADLWGRLGTGDPEGFARQFMAIYFRGRDQGPEYLRDLFYGTEIRAGHSETIVETFGRLLKAAKECDPDGLITDALLGSAHGRLYQMILEQRETPS